MRYKIPLEEIQHLLDTIPGKEDIGAIQDDGSVIVYQGDLEKFNSNPIEELVPVEGGDTTFIFRDIEDYCDICYGTTFSERFKDFTEFPFEIYNYLADKPSEDQKYKAPFHINFKSDLIVKPTKLPVIFDRKGNPESKEYSIDGKKIAKREFEFRFFTKNEMLADEDFVKILMGMAEAKGLPQNQTVYENIAESLADHLVWTRLEKFKFAHEDGSYSEEYKPAPMDYVTFNNSIDLVSYYNFRKNERVTGRSNIVTNLEPLIMITLIGSNQFSTAAEAQMTGASFLSKYGVGLDNYIKSGDTSIYNVIKEDTDFNWLDIEMEGYDNVTIRKFIVNRLKQLEDSQLSSEL